MRAYLQTWSNGTQNLIVHGAGLPFGWHESNIDQATEERARKLVLKTLGSAFNDVAWLDEKGERIVKILPIKW